ncbi:PadR family transcriptional regulator [bacterium]|nr:MAG: PadR family transcriptional regulator [bacterium]
MTRRILGSFQESIMLCARDLGANAYGAKIISELRRRGWYADNATLPVYTTIDRLRKSGLIHTENSEPVPIRGGRSRVIVTLTEEGLEALRVTAEAHRIAFERTQSTNEQKEENSPHEAD